MNELALNHGKTVCRDEKPLFGPVAVLIAIDANSSVFGDELTLARLVLKWDVAVHDSVLAGEDARDEIGTLDDGSVDLLSEIFVWLRAPLDADVSESELSAARDVLCQNRRPLILGIFGEDGGATSTVTGESIKRCSTGSVANGNGEDAEI